MIKLLTRERMGGLFRGQSVARQTRAFWLRLLWGPVDQCQQFTHLVLLALLLPEATEAHGGTQLPGPAC
jgi:hypothetical protein